MNAMSETIGRRWGIALLSSAVLFLAGAPGLAQEYPARPVRFVVPSGPGIATDLIMRLVVNKLNDRLNWNGVVENRPGGNFVIGMQHVLQSPADGYTVLGAVSSMAILPTSTKNLPFDVLRDFIPVTRTANLQVVVVSGPALAVTSLPELVAYAKANPGKLSFGSASAGSLNHLAGELLKQSTGIEMINIPYKNPTFVNDVIAGTLPLAFTTVSTVSPLVKAGRLRALGIIGPKRSPVLPDVPTIAETGLPDVDADGWLGVMVRAGVPAAIVNRLNREIVAVMNLPEIREQVIKSGSSPIGESPEEFRVKFESDVRRWAEVIRRANVIFE